MKTLKEFIMKLRPREGFMQGQELSTGEYAALKRLSSNQDFQTFRRIIEDYQQQRAFNLIAGTEKKDKSATAELEDNRGGYRLWKKAMSYVDNSQEYLEILTQQKDDEDKLDD